MILDAFCDLLASAINKSLVFEPQNMQYLEQLEGKWVLVDLTDLQIGMIFGFVNKRVLVRIGHQPEQVDATIRGRSVDLFLMAIATANAEHQTPGQGQQVRIEGDIACGMALRELLQQVQVPLDRIAAHYLGEGPAYWLGAFKRGAEDLGKAFVERVENQGVGYIRDELGVAVTASEVDSFCIRVDACRDHLARIEQKLQKFSE